MKSITDLFLRYPIIALVVNLAIVLVGLRAIFLLPIQQFPRFESTSITIRTFYIGASAETIRGFLTVPIERAVSSIAGVDYIESSSTAGSSTVTVRLKLNHSSTQALTEVNARLQQIRRELPNDAEPPSVFIQRADRPNASMYISFTSDEWDISQITDWISRNIQPQLSTVDGIQNIGVEAGRLPAMRIWILPQRLSELNLTAGEVFSALQRNNFLAAIGRVKNEDSQVDLVTNTDLKSVREFEELVVIQRPTGTIRLKDVARVELGAEEAGAVAMYKGHDAVYVSVWPLPGVNEIDVSRRLRAALDDLRGTLPEHLKANVAFDATRFMEDALTEIGKTLFETILIVGFVVFLFVGSIRTALVPLIAMPVSLIGAALLMYLMGFSLNLLTILAIVLSVGLVVDDAIVVVENIQRHVQNGESRLRAAVMGSRELVGPIIAMTITLAVVYTPIGFQTGLTGMLFREFAFSLAAAVIVSGFAAITLSPIMSAYLIRPSGRESWLSRQTNRFFDWLKEVYGAAVQFAVQIRWALIAMTLMITCFAWPLYLQSGRELAPVEDQSNISIGIQAAPDASLEATAESIRQLSKKLLTIPEVDYVWAVALSSGGFGGIRTVDFDQRSRTTKELLNDVYERVADATSLKAFPGLPSSLPGAGSSDVELIVKTDRPVEEYGPQAREIISKGYASGRFRYVDSDLKVDLPQAIVEVDRMRVADLGMDLAAVGRELGVLLGGAYVNRFNYFNRNYQVIPQLEEQSRQDAASLLDLKVRSPVPGGSNAESQMIPVSSFVSINPQVAPRSLQRFQQQNSLRLTASVAEGMTKADGMNDLEAIARDVLGADAKIDYGGESRQIRTEGAAFVVTMGFALILIYLTLTAQFHSFRDPLIVLLGSVPLAISSALAWTFTGWTTINIYSQVGLITLVGLVAKNGILIVEFANHLQEGGMSKGQAIIEAAKTRLRPILMTSAATVLGHFPLVLVVGPGAEARNSIGIVLVAGMAIGTMFTLFVVPALYYVIASDHKHSDQRTTDADFA
ncbi:MAG: efflux RND transporter permease subunit [Pirellula sp.]|nr:efflux RND transporter permease subunit [Pirellula sp.]